MEAKIFSFIFVILYVTIVDTVSGCEEEASYSSPIFVEIDNEDYYVVPDYSKWTSSFKQLTTTKNESKKIDWQIRHCGNCDVIITHPGNTRLVWYLKGSCEKATNVVMAEIGDLSIPSVRFSLAPMRVCGKCLYRDETNGNIMVASNCEGKDTRFYL